MNTVYNKETVTGEEILRSHVACLLTYKFPCATKDQGFLVSPQDDIVTEHIFVVMLHAKDQDQKLLLDLVILPLSYRGCLLTCRFYWFAIR